MATSQVVQQSSNNEFVIEIALSCLFNRLAPRTAIRRLLRLSWRIPVITNFRDSLEEVKVKNYGISEQAEPAWVT